MSFFVFIDVCYTYTHVYIFKHSLLLFISLFFLHSPSLYLPPSFPLSPPSPSPLPSQHLTLTPYLPSAHTHTFSCLSPSLPLTLSLTLPPPPPPHPLTPHPPPSPVPFLLLLPSHPLTPHTRKHTHLEQHSGRGGGCSTGRDRNGRRGGGNHQSKSR